MAVLLIAHDSVLGWLYAAAATSAFGYHWFEQQRFSKLDHSLAWACIASNFWLAWHTRSLLTTLAGAAAVVRALVSYTEAHHPPPDYGLLPQAASDHYDEHHTYWHLWCGIAGWLLAWGHTIG